MGGRVRDSVWDRHGVVAGLLRDVGVPLVSRVRQVFDTSRIADIPAEVRAQIGRPEIRARLRPGARLAITVGSRGIANLPLLVRSIAEALRAQGCSPFVVPAMGSHGGATAEGQLALLAGMGVTEPSVGVPIRSSMETVVVGRTAAGRPVHLDRIASEADGIVVFGRIKPHTAFRGPHESGLLKMIAIGLGKRQGAEAVHAQGFGRMSDNVPDYARVTLSSGKIALGLAVVENALDQTSLIEAITAERIMDREPELLEIARHSMPHLKLDPIDVLVCDRIGKDFSGDGMDPNITGSYSTPYATGGPRVERYVVLDLSEETHGNALGAGMAHFTTKRLFDKTDFDASYPNALTCRVVVGARMPLVLATDRLAIQAAIYTVTDGDASRPRIVRIPDTSHVELIEISEALLPEARDRGDLQILEAPRPLPFDAAGNLLPP
jgi:hypothetical protein